MSRNLPRKKRLLGLIALPAWVLLAFFLSQLLVGIVLALFELAGVTLDGLSTPVQNTVIGAIIYTLTLGIAIGVPWLLFKQKTSSTELGLQRGPSWFDIGITPLGYIAYIVLSALLLAVAQLLPFFDVNQPQETGFEGISLQYEYILAFVTLVIVAPVAEEILFRGYLFSKLRARAPLWIAILITSALFGLVHFAWNVGIDTFALSIILCLLVVWSKSLWPAILLHMLKNFVAFYFLFINPNLLTTLGG